jgi:GAF domain-containing protein
MLGRTITLGKFVHTMSPRTWLLFLITYACLALALDAWAISRWERITDRGVAGSLGVRLATAEGHNNFQITSLSSDSPLRAAGATVGDVVKFDLRTDISRFLAKTDTVGLTLHHGETSKHLSLSPTSADDVIQVSVQGFILDWVGNIVAILCGIVLAIRRSGPGPHRVLSVLLVTIGFGDELHGLPHPFHDMFFRFAFPILMMAGWLSFPFFAMIFPNDAPLFQRKWPRKAFLAVLAWLAVPVILKVAIREGLLSSQLIPDPITVFMDATGGFACVAFGFVALWMSWRRSKGSTRQAIEWTAFSLGLIYFTWTIPVLNGALDYVLPAEALFDALTVVRVGACILLVYALLRRRLFDVGFVFNHALVVAIISSALLVVFAITEFAVDKLLHFHGRETNIVIDAAVALGVILCFHRIQHWVSHQVNHFFFHHWHEAAEGFRTFLSSASHVTDPSALREKFVAAVGRFSNADGVACYARDTNGNFVAQEHTLATPARMIDANHDLIIALQQHRAAVEHGNGWAFPMMLRGTLAGFVFIGAKRNSVAYRPDELNLMQQGAQQLALDLERLRVLSMEQEREAWLQTELTLRARCDAYEALLRTKLAPSVIATDGGG